MGKFEIILSKEQLTTIRNQLASVLADEINEIRTQEIKNNRYMNKKQTCNYLHVSNNTLDIWIQQGLPRIKLQNSIRFDKIAIDKWMNNLEKTS